MIKKIKKLKLYSIWSIEKFLCRHLMQIGRSLSQAKKTNKKVQGDK